MGNWDGGIELRADAWKENLVTTTLEHIFTKTLYPIFPKSTVTYDSSISHLNPGIHGSRFTSGSLSQGVFIPVCWKANRLTAVMSSEVSHIIFDTSVFRISFNWQGVSAVASVWMSLRGSFSCQKRSPHLSDLNCSPRIHWKVAPSKPPLGSALSRSPEEECAMLMRNLLRMHGLQLDSLKVHSCHFIGLAWLKRQRLLLQMLFVTNQARQPSCLTFSPATFFSTFLSL